MPRHAGVDTYRNSCADRLSLPSQDIILGQGMQLFWYQPTHGAYLHIVTGSFSRLLPNCGTVFRSSDINSCKLIAYIDIAKGSSCVVPSADLSTLPPTTKRRAGTR